MPAPGLQTGKLVHGNALSGLCLCRTIEVGFCLEDYRDHNADSRKDGAHPQYPSPVRSRIGNKAAENTPEGVSKGNVDSVTMSMI